MRLLNRGISLPGEGILDWGSQVREGVLKKQFWAGLNEGEQKAGVSGARGSVRLNGEFCWCKVPHREKGV